MTFALIKPNPEKTICLRSQSFIFHLPTDRENRANSVWYQSLFDISISLFAANIFSGFEMENEEEKKKNTEQFPRWS